MLWQNHARIAVHEISFPDSVLELTSLQSTSGDNLKKRLCVCVMRNIGLKCSAFSCLCVVKFDSHGNWIILLVFISETVILVLKSLSHVWQLNLVNNPTVQISQVSDSHVLTHYMHTVLRGWIIMEEYANFCLSRLRQQILTKGPLCKPKITV